MRHDWPQHDYTVKDVKTFRGMEGEGFNATLCRDGRKIAFAIDDATGGEIHIQWTGGRARAAEEKRLLEFLKTLPKERWEDTEYDVTPDMFLAVLVDEAQIEKRLRRLFRRETLFRLKSDQTGADEWRVLNAPFSPRVKAHLAETYGDRLGRILNEEYPHLNPGMAEGSGRHVTGERKRGDAVRNSRAVR